MVPFMMLETIFVPLSFRANSLVSVHWISGVLGIFYTNQKSLATIRNSYARSTIHTANNTVAVDKSIIARAGKTFGSIRARGIRVTIMRY